MPEPLALMTASTADTAAEFEALVGPWVAQMYRLAAAIVGIDGAEEVTQEALVDAWRGLAKLRDRSRVHPWLNAIVANRASKFIRSQRSRPRSIAVDPAGIAGQGTQLEPDHVAALAERDRLDRAFHSLSADQRTAVVMHYSFDLSVPEIGRTLGVPEGTVKSRIHAGIERLRRALDEEER